MPDFEGISGDLAAGTANVVAMESRKPVNKLDDPDLDLHLPAPYLHPEAKKATKKGSRKPREPLLLFGCGGRI
jgi:hypothetical protein